MKKILLSFFLLASLSQLLAQQPAGLSKKGMFPELVRFKKENAPALVRGMVHLQTPDGQLVSAPGKIIHDEKDNIGQEHVRTQQTINGFPVEDAVYVQHVVNGKVISGNGRWIMNLPRQLAGEAVLSKDAALQKALQQVGATVYKWQEPAEEALLKRETGDPKATYYPAGELVYYNGEREVVDTSTLRLAYKFDIYAHRPVSRQYVFVDAQNGQVLGTRQRIFKANIPAMAITVYSGAQTIITDSDNGVYRLRDASRGKGIITLNLQKTADYANAADFTNTTTTWNNSNATMDQYATDAHWGAEKTYDYYLNNYGRNSLDNNGMALYSYLHFSSNFFNAYWDGSRMTYGDGDARDNYQPLTSLDICGHEITHGLTEHTSQLNYSDESGALNEGFSDIFGTAIENFARPSKWDWLIGGDFYPVRDMRSPNLYQQPATYKGKYWYTGTNQDYLVHTNSGVLNRWFYLITSGGVGTNDNGCFYTVNGIGIQKAAAIAYRTNTQYLVSTSNYADAARFSIQSAKDLYGEWSNEATQTANAWTAVGILNDPDVPVLSASKTLLSPGGTSTLSVASGSLNSATGWYWYSGSCSGVPLGTGTSVNVSPVVTTTYYVRGEGGCNTPGACAYITIVVDTSSTGNPVVTCPWIPAYCYSTTGIYTLAPALATDHNGIPINNFTYSIAGATVRSGTGADASGKFNPGNSVITWTVKDGSGNLGSCSSTITVNNPIHVTVPDVYAISAGGKANTLYIGYGPQSVALTAMPDGGTAGYTYAWSTGGTTNQLKVSPAAAGSSAYSVTVKDIRGCPASVTKPLVAEDVRCGNKNDKIVICKPNGNGSKSKTDCVNENTVDKELANGATLGACPVDSKAPGSQASAAAVPGLVVEEMTPMEAAATPNPSLAGFRLQVKSSSSKPVTLRVTDVAGRLIETRSTTVANGPVIIGSNFLPGIYVLQVTQGNERVTIKLVRQ